MDASNPVMSSDRYTIETILERTRGVKRQDLGYLAEVARTSQRVILPTTINLPLVEVKQIVSEFKEQQIKVSSDKDGELDPNTFDAVYESIPVCGIIDAEGVCLHPPGVNNKQGRLSVSRKMGGQPGPPLGLVEIVEVFGQDVLNREKIYTGGTWKGFLERLNQQMARKTVPLSRTCARGSTPLVDKTLFKMLDKLMPRNRNPEWPGLCGDDFYTALTQKLKITSNASAGAPYWRNKGQCMEQIVETGLPIVLKALKENSIPQLFKENPEMFICEVKNKMDRYDIAKLEEKTRPYVCVPAHWAFLFSMLCQGFQETLLTFVQDPTSSNAYGFSSSKGGLKKMVDWMYTADRRGKVVCYGDDACIVVRRGDDVYRIDPDFKQMDGSLDREDIRITIQWILSHVKRDTGDVNHIWKAIAQVWEEMASDPLFVVDGTTVYKKKNAGGLMTGVPGTTLFDTVKSVLAWNTLLDEVAAGAGDILNEAFVTKWMKAQGLVVKAGTWKPTKLPKNLNPGDLVTDHKFLGVQIRCVSWRDTVQFVPTIPESDALEMLVTQKDNPFDKKVSRIGASRTLYDRMRGLMITMGFNHPSVTSAIHNVVNKLPPEVILMQTQLGTGERPDHITLQDFNYPDSSGFPSIDFCISVYSDLDVEEGWIQLFPDLTDRLNDMKAGRRGLERKYRALLTPVDSGLRPTMQVTMVAEPDVPIPPAYEVVEAVEAVKTELPTVVNPRSKIFQLTEQGAEVLRKQTPTLGQTIRTLVEARGGITQVNTICYELNLDPRQVAREAEKYGFYLTGVCGFDLISLYPLVTPMATKQEEIFHKLQENRMLIGKGSEEREQGLKAAERLVETAPELVLLNLDLLGELSSEESTVADDEKALVYLNVLLARNGFTMRWRTQTDPNRANSVGAFLEVAGHPGKEPHHWTVCAEAWSLSRALAQRYIARAILQAAFIDVEESRFSVFYVPPPAEFGDGFSWADETDRELEPRRQPTVVGTDQLTESNDKVVRLVGKQLPHVPSKFVEMAYQIATFNKKLPDQDIVMIMHKILQKADSVHGWSSSSDSSSGIGSSPPSSPSKRSQLSVAVRKNQNRKKMLKRRAKLSSSPQQSQ